METNVYKEYFQAIKPIATQKIAEITEAFLEKFPNLSPGEIIERGDEESILTVDFSEEGEFVLGIDITLARGGIYDDEFGVGIKLDMQGPGGESLGQYLPDNYSDEFYTVYKSVLIARVNDINVQEILEHVKQYLDEAGDPFKYSL